MWLKYTDRITAALGNVIKVSSKHPGGVFAPLGAWSWPGIKRFDVFSDMRNVAEILTGLHGICHRCQCCHVKIAFTRTTAHTDDQLSW